MKNVNGLANMLDIRRYTIYKQNYMPTKPANFFFHLMFSFFFYHSYILLKYVKIHWHVKNLNKLREIFNKKNKSIFEDFFMKSNFHKILYKNKNFYKITLETHILGKISENKISIKFQFIFYLRNIIFIKTL